VSKDLQKEVQRKLEDFIASFNKLKNAVDEEIHRLEEAKSKHTQEAQDMDNLRVKWSSIIKLNVGGDKYTTTLTTLTQHSGSMLAVMFSGRHEVVLDDEKCVFIDRDGMLFRHVLAFLREGDAWQPPQDDTLNRRIAKEFDYYGLQCTHFAPKQQVVTSFTLNFAKTSAGSWYSVSHFARGYEIKVLKTFTLQSAQAQIKLPGTLRIAQNKLVLKDVVMTTKSSDIVASDTDISFTFRAGETYDVFFIGKGQFFNWEGAKSHRIVGEHITAASKSYDDQNSSTSNAYSLFFVFTCV